MSPEANNDYPNVPMRPSEVLGVKADTFPEEVYIAVNGLITERLEGRYAKLTIRAIRKRMQELGLDRKEILQRNWDQVGAVYENAGWDVSYHYPDAESRDFDPFYLFSTKDDRSW